MPKIAYIGAGSKGFARNLITDMLFKPALADSDFVLMDISAENLAYSMKFAEKLKRQQASPMRITATTSLEEALDGADYVFETTLKHGLETRKREHECCHKYGLYPYSGCTTGPCGVFRALREIPATLEILRVMERVCPKACYLHYANPTNTVSLGLSVASPIQSIGLCHSVEGTAKMCAGMLNLPFNEISYWAAGVNHQAWILRLTHKGRDVMPELRKIPDNPFWRKHEPVRLEILKFFDYITTESSPHNSEYMPYFRRTRADCERWVPGFPLDDKYSAEIAGREEQRREMVAACESDAPIRPLEHCEYCVRVVDAMVSNTPFVFHGNILNTERLITNLPAGLCVEVPIMADAGGFHPFHVGALPDQCAALNANRSAGDLLAVKAALTGDVKAVEQAVALDPLTAAVLSLDQIKSLVADLLVADRPYLPQFFPKG